MTILTQTVRRLSRKVLKETPLHDWHVSRGGKMVDFAGWSLPVQYSDGVIANHTHVRAAAGLFDVSHMRQVRVSGPAATDLLEAASPGGIEELLPNRASLCVLTNENGGIVDDFVVTRVDTNGDAPREDRSYEIVFNAARADADLAHLEAVRSSGALSDPEAVSVSVIEDTALLAVQGPRAAECLSAVAADAEALSRSEFMTAIDAVVAGAFARVTRCGYTGEDGFELRVPAEEAVQVAESILSVHEGVTRPAGLAVRDTLRLEAGLCLYGNDIDEATTPAEAVLLWTIPKRRRIGGGFPGHAVLFNGEGKIIKPARKRIGIRFSGKMPVRAGAPLFAAGSGESIGAVTSGAVTPSVTAPIAMGMVDAGSAAIGTEIEAEVRGKRVVGKVSKMPFVPANYYRGYGPPM